MTQAIAVPHLKTFGEVFPTFMIELVMPADSVDPCLLLWDGQRAYTERSLHMSPGPNSAFKSRAYEHPDVDPTIWNAIRLPTHAADYGSTHQLFSDLCKLIHRFTGVTEAAVQISAQAVLASWFADCRTCSLCVSIAGHTAGLQLFQLLSSVYRRAFVLDASSLSRLSSIPSKICFCPFIDGSKRDSPTELAGLVTDGQIVSVGDSVQKMWDAGAFGSGFRGERINLVVPAVTGSCPVLNPSIEEDVAAEFQPKLLMYRLRNYRDIFNTGCARAPRVEPGLTHCLAACIPGDPDLQKEIHSVLNDRVQANLPIKRPLKNVVVDALLCLCHEHPRSKTLPVAKLAAAVNAELRRCGDRRSLSTRVITNNLKQLDFPTERLRGSVRDVCLDPPARKKIHEVAENRNCLELDLGCRECSEIQRRKEESEPVLPSLSFGGIETYKDAALMIDMMKDDDEGDDPSLNRQSASCAPPVHLIVFGAPQFARRR